MKPVLHIVRKDLARLRWWLVAWLGVLLLPVLFGFDLLVRGPLPGNDGSMDRINSALLGLEGLVVYVLTILLIQEDAIVGTRQFWLTRPITSGQLLAAKALGAIAIFGAMPVVVSAPWWWWCGFGLREMSIAALESCALAALVAIPAALVAVLTDSLARALLWTMVLIAAIPVTGEFFTAAIRAAMTPADFPGLAVSRAVLAVAAIAGEFLLVVVAKYYLRQRGRWLALAGIAVVLTLASATAWPWSIVGRNESREINPERARGVNVRFGAAKPGDLGGAIGGQTELRWQTLEVDVVATGAPRDENVWAMGADQHWRGAGGATIDFRGRFQGDFLWLRSVGGMRAPMHDDETRRWWSERVREAAQRGRFLSLSPQLDRPEGEFPFRAGAFLWASQVDRLRRESPRYDARVWLELVRADIAVETPLEAGRWQRGRGRGMRIDRVFPDAERPVIQMVDTQPGFLSDQLRREAAEGRWFDEAELWKNSAWVAIVSNRARGEFMQVWDRSPRRRALVVNGVQINWHTLLRLSVPWQVRDGHQQPVPGWLDGVTFGLATLHRDAVVARDVQVPRFVVTERNAVGSR
jgi:hypothetical protein